MTTPERFRRRQLIEGAVLIVLAIFTVLQTISFNLEARDQQKCLEQSFSDLNQALETRAALGSRESAANRGVLDAFAAAAANPAQYDRKKLINTLLDYKKTMEQVSKERKQNPFPPYPAGKCD